MAWEGFLDETLIELRLKILCKLLGKIRDKIKGWKGSFRQRTAFAKAKNFKNMQYIIKKTKYLGTASEQEPVGRMKEYFWKARSRSRSIFNEILQLKIWSICALEIIPPTVTGQPHVPGPVLGQDIQQRTKQRPHLEAHVLVGRETRNTQRNRCQ